MVDSLGNVAARAETAWIGLTCGDNLLFREAISAKLALIKTELLGANPSALERLLVERIAACWLQVGYADGIAAQSAQQSIGWATFQQKRQTLAQRRLLAAIKALAEVRKLLGPTIQVNIAEQQVNVATTHQLGDPFQPEKQSLDPRDRRSIAKHLRRDVTRGSGRGSCP